MSASPSPGPDPIPRPPLPGGPFLVVGLARSGQAVARLLAERGERVVAVDAASPGELAGLRTAGVEVHTDEAGVDLLDRVKTLVKSPGVPQSAPVVTAARELGLPVLGELELGWRLLPNRLIAVTGTNGKTTVTEWLGHLWRQARLPVAVAGNVGVPLSELAGKLDPNAIVICECSSFQLEDSESFAPEIGVFLNFSPDHIDRHGNLDDYLGAKLRIFSGQPPGSVAIWDADEPALPATPPGAAGARPYGIAACEDGTGAHRCSVFVRDGVLRTASGPLLDVGELALAGEHNLRNAMAVAAAALAAGLPDESIVAGLRSFEGVPHRLERVRERAGVSFVNDSKATNVAAAAAALRSFTGGVRAILGGSLKGGDFRELAAAVSSQCRAVYLIGEAAPALAADLGGTGVELIDAGGLEEAVALAAADAVAGETVLLAPACASFDAFRNYEHRGDRFRELVQELP